MKRVLTPFVPFFLLSLLVFFWGGLRVVFYQVLTKTLYLPALVVESRLEEVMSLREERDSLVKVNLIFAGKLRKCISEGLVVTWSKGFEGEPVRILALRPLGIPTRLILEGGNDRGFKYGAPVLQRGYFVGKLSEVFGSTSTALTLFSRELRVGVANIRSGVIGVLQGGTNPKVKYIPKGSDVKVGDTLVTSGLGGVFPRGIPVGVITSVEKSEDELFLGVWVNPLFDVSLLGSVEVVIP